MTTLQISGTALQVRFTPLEKVLGLVRDHDVPLSSVVTATLADDGLAAARGIRAPGLGIPGRRKLGTWRGRGRTLVSARRGQPAVVLELDGQRFVRMVLGADDAHDLAARLTQVR